MDSADGLPLDTARTLDLSEAPDETLKTPTHLVFATSLGDSSLLDRLEECRRQDLEGIPLEELLGYMEEAARESTI